MVKETSANSKVSSKASISQAAFSSSAITLSGANHGFKISIVSKLLSKIHSKEISETLAVCTATASFIEYWKSVSDISLALRCGFSQQFAGNCLLSRLHTCPLPFLFPRL